MAGLLVGVVVAAGTGNADAQWPQWCGPNRSFTVETEGLADSWPKDGPKRLWHRELGVGYSAIVVDDGMAYTMYRKSRTSEQEFIVALDTATGRTIWEQQVAAPIREPGDERWGGQGPNSTPLLAGNRLYSVGSNAMLNCFDKRTGKVLWAHDLTKEFNAQLTNSVGYCSSPVAYKELVIVAAGGAESDANTEKRVAESPALIAFDQVSGSVVWKGLDLLRCFSSPILIRFDGQDQLVTVTKEGMSGVNPNNGQLLWQHPGGGTFITPVWNGKDLLFRSTSADHNLVGQAIRLTKKSGKIVPEEVWSSKKVRMQQATPVRIGDHMYGTTDRILVAVEFETGKRAWVERSFPMASCVYGDGKLILLDQDGNLTLATATPEGLTVHSKCQISERYSLTVPTLAGKTLYVRDRKHIMALDLS